MKLIREIYQKLFGIEDAPHKVSAGFALGVFFGVMPAMGPLIAVFFSVLFRINRAAALIGSLLTNMWLSIPSIFAALFVGQAVTGTSSSQLRADWKAVCEDFSWQVFAGGAYRDIIIPVLAGYIIVASILAIFAYFVTFAVLYFAKRR